MTDSVMEVTVKRIGQLKLALLSISALWLMPAQAAPGEIWGKVSMQGSIVDTACAIDTGSYEQSIDMGILPIGLLRQVGHGPVQPFSIALIGCKLTPHDGDNWQTFSVTFDGPANGEWFTVSGAAKGVALSLQDASGQTVQPGLATSKQDIKPGDHVLNYGLRLVSDETPLRPGEYQTAIRFKLDYY
ncbi:fimbrial protein [Providencia sp.]|uniref:fimbrial protein n=1 Tax=Providencia sp. TaxID=589 RepID=UPI003F96DFFA